MWGKNLNSMWFKISLSIQNHNYQYTQRKHNHDISSVETISIQSCPIYIYKKMEVLEVQLF